MKTRTHLRSKEKNNKGITLVALVITIIVLIILVTISISVLTGENGILTKAEKAKNQAIEAEEKEQISLAYSTVMTDKLQGEISQIQASNLQTELDKQKVEASALDSGSKIQIIFTKTGNIYELEAVTGTIDEISTAGKPNYNGGRTVREAKEQNVPFKEKTEIKDNFENKVVVPEGFKIASDSSDNVTGGVVIEDVKHGITVGSQFVWIPVGNVKYSGGIKTINLDRYTFASDGTPTGQGDKAINDYCEELATSDKGNIVAKDIEKFKTSVMQNGGYYIGRYEGRTKTERTGKTDNDNELEKATVKPNDYVYNFVTQPQAAKLSQEMYKEDNNSFTSDLVNSYAWDTAVVFLQEFDNRSNKTKPYSSQNSLNSGNNLAKKGTNDLIEENLQDKICNIWDMASNTYEWSTETYTTTDDSCIHRGGSCSDSSYGTVERRDGYKTSVNLHITFRTLLYMKN